MRAGTLEQTLCGLSHLFLFFLFRAKSSKHRIRYGTFHALMAGVSGERRIHYNQVYRPVIDCFPNMLFALTGGSYRFRRDCDNVKRTLEV
ncbi:hypothetical protein ES708_25793 [subsurface metagenome]